MRTFIVDPKEKVLRDLLPRFASPPACFKRLTDAEIEAGEVVGELVASTSVHPLVQAVHLSFAQHRPLALRPDDFWLCIAQGLSNHINANAERVRSLFVAHQGKKSIEVRRDSFIKGSPDNDWKGVFQEFDAQIAERLKGESHQRLKAWFSTTGPVDTAAYSIVLMEAMKAYFTYGVSTLCCVPEVTLLGETHDWKRLHGQTQRLQQWWTEQTANLSDPQEVSLDWWLLPLMRVLDQVVETAVGGTVDTKFWASIYKEGGGSGGPYVTGWINTLFPYLVDGGVPKRRNVFVEKWEQELGHGGEGPTTDDFPTGVSVVPFIWKYHTEEYRMSFLGGFAGVSQDPNTFEVQATTGWAVCEAKARRRAASPAVASPRDVGPSPREEGQRRMFKWLSSGAALEEANGRGKLAHHRRLLLSLAAELPPDSPIATALEVLAAALLLDLPFLRTYPEALLPVLHWRCSAHDNPVLAGLARRWWAERRQEGVWVHALTPPPHAPGGPLLAELRMERPHELRSPMTSEGHVVLDEQGVIHHWLPEEGALVEGPDVARPTHRQELLHRLPVPEGGEATGGSFSPDGTLYALAGYGEDFCFGFLHLHEAATGRLVHQWRGLWPFWKRPVFSPDGRHVLALSEGGLLLCDTVTGQQEHLPIRDAKGAAFSADGRRLVTTDKEGVRLWDLARLRAWEPQEPEYSRPMGFSPDGRRLVVGEWLRDGATGQRLRKLGFDRGKYLMGGPPRNWFTCGSARIVSLREGLHVWDTESGEPVAHRSDVHYGYWHVTAFSADGLRYAVATEGSSTVEVLEVDTGELLARFELAEGGVNSLALLPEGQGLAIGTREGPIEVWSVTGGQRLATLRGHRAPVNALAFSLDARRLVSAGDNEALRIWALPGGEELASRPLETSKALRELSGWEGFVGPSPMPFSVEVQEGVTFFLDRETRQPVAVFPVAGPWLSHPDGVTWASPTVHVVLEGATALSSEGDGTTRGDKVRTSESQGPGAGSPPEEPLSLQLEASEERLRVVLGSTDSSVFEVDGEGRYLAVRARSDEPRAMPGAEVGRTLADTLAPQLAARFLERLRRVLSTRERERFEYLLDAGGRRHCFTAEVLPASRRERVVILVRDITQRKRLELKLRQAEVGTTAAVLNRELLNPLKAVASILLFLDRRLAELRKALSEPDGPSNPHELLRMLEQPVELVHCAQEDTERIRTLVTGLTTFLQQEALDPWEEVADVRQVLKTALHQSLPLLESRARVVHDVGELPAVRGNEWWLEQVFHTLLHNAAEATRVGAPGENTLEVRAWAEPGEVVVEVHDTGTLIPAEDLERLFEPSFSSKTVRWSLAVSHGLVSAMMGELTVKSTAGKGTCFRVRLPAA